MTKRKNKQKKESFMDELENTENTEEIEETEKEIESENEETDPVERPVRNRKGLSSVSMSLKRIRKTMEGIDLNNISVADKFDLRMASSYIDFLKETIDSMVEKIK